MYRRSRDATLVVSSDRPPPEIEAKPYSPKLKAGEYLHFVLRAEITRSRYVEGERGKRYDPVLEQRNLDRSRSYADIVREVGSEWLEQKSARHGFEIEELVRTDYNPVEFVRPTDRKQIRLAVINFEGILEVTDSDAFVGTLKSGIGRAKGFGCGLMLVRRVS